MFSVTEMMILLAAIVGSGSTVGFAGWLVYRIRRIESNSPNRELLEQMTQQIEQLREQGELARDEILELQERIDFAERLLTRGEQAKEDN